MKRLRVQSVNFLYQQEHVCLTSIKTFLEINSSRIQFKSANTCRKSARLSVEETSNLSTGDSSGEGVNRGPAGSRGTEKEKEKMERSIREGRERRRHKEISLSRIFDQPLGRANSLARNNWITSKRGARYPRKRFSEKVGIEGSSLEKRMIICVITSRTINRN